MNVIQILKCLIGQHNKTRILIEDEIQVYCLMCEKHFGTESFIQISKSILKELRISPDFAGLCAAQLATEAETLRVRRLNTEFCFKICDLLDEKDKEIEDLEHCNEILTKLLD